MYCAPRRVPQPSSSGFALLLGTAFLLLLSSGDILAGASSSSTSSSSSNYYESVRSLDEYGNAVQIQHAQAAADQRGRLVLAMHHNEQVWIVSPARPALSTGHYLRPPQSSCGLLEPVTTAPLKAVADMELTTTSTTAAAVYLCCTGVQADAHALLQHVRRYAATVAERYNNHAPQSLAYAVAQFHRQFWGYSPEGTWTTTVANLQQQQQQQPSWGRPLGVRSLVVTCGRPNGGSGVQIQLVEPSGLIREREQDAVWILGPQSDLVWQALAKQPPQPQQQSRRNVHDQRIQNIISYRPIPQIT